MTSTEKQTPTHDSKWDREAYRDHSGRDFDSDSEPPCDGYDSCSDVPLVDLDSMSLSELRAYVKDQGYDRKYVKGSDPYILKKRIRAYEFLDNDRRVGFLYLMTMTELRTYATERGCYIKTQHKHDLLEAIHEFEDPDGYRDDEKMDIFRKCFAVFNPSVSFIFTSRSASSSSRSSSRSSRSRSRSSSRATSRSSSRAPSRTSSRSSRSRSRSRSSCRSLPSSASRSRSRSPPRSRSSRSSSRSRSSSSSSHSHASYSTSSGPTRTVADDLKCMREDLVSIQASNAAYYATLDRKEMLSSANKRLQALAEKQVKLAQLMREIEELEYIRNTDMKVKSNILMLDSEYGLKYDLASQDPFETPAQRENRLRREARAAKKTDDELDDEVSKAADLLQDTTM